jgi:D-arabinose 1-dehydrogenase-like Zn-dependent alcohol dehydrogenase
MSFNVSISTGTRADWRTATYSLVEVNRALADLRTGKIDGTAVLVMS